MKIKNSTYLNGYLVVSNLCRLECGGIESVLLAYLISKWHEDSKPREVLVYRSKIREDLKISYHLQSKAFKRLEEQNYLTTRRGQYAATPFTLNQEKEI